MNSPVGDQKHQRNLLEILFDHVPMGIAVFDGEFRLQRWNSTWAGFIERYTRWPAEQVASGISLFDLVPGNEVGLRELLEPTLTGEIVRREAVRIQVDSVVSYWDVVFAPIVDDGSVVGIVGAAIDATERELVYQTLEQRVASRTRELAALYDVTAVASESLDLETTLASSLDRVLAVMESEVGAIHLIDEAEETLRLVAWRGIPSDVVAEVDTVPLSGGLTSWVIERSEPLVVSEIASGPRPLRAIPARGTQAYVGAPMRARGRVLGVLSVVGDVGRQFSVEEIALLASIADQVAIAIENAQFYQQAEQLAVMKERSRLAHELHDSVTQSLYSLTLYAEASRRLVAAGHATQAGDYLAQLGQTAQQALKEMRLLVYQLRPPALETQGLVGALQQRLEAVEKRTGIDVELAVDGTVELPASVEVGLYGIAQEALNNALKHAAATKVTVRIRAAGDGVELEITDNGRGFDVGVGVQNGGMGLHTMRERAEQLGGTLTVQSEPGQGTRVCVVAPVHSQSRR